MQNKEKQIAKRHNSLQIKKIKNIFQNETKQIKWKINLLQDRLEQFKKILSYFKMGWSISQKCRILHKMN